MSVSRIYRLVKNLYGVLPYWFSHAGRAFPACHYDFELTLRCNLRCRMCQFLQVPEPTPAGTVRTNELTTQEWFDIIDGVPRFALITFTGGEPLLRLDFMRILKRASARHRTHFITNGYLLTLERVEDCLTLAPKRLTGVGLNFIGISIDGPEPIHDTVRGAKGTFDRAIQAIRLLREGRRRFKKRAPLVHVTSVIQEANLDHLVEMPGIAKEAGADILNFTLEIRTFTLPGLSTKDPWSYRNNELVLPRLDPRRVRQMLSDVRKAAAKARIQLRLPGMPDDEIVRYYDGGLALPKYRCRAIWSDLVVDSTGDMYLGCRLKKIGNARHRPPGEAWNGPESRQFRRAVRNGLPVPCAGCCYLEYHG